MSERPSLLPLPVVAVAALVACGGTSVYRPASAANFQLEDPRDIDDEQIRAAFDARPRVAGPVRVAFYAFGDDRSDEIESMLRALPGVSGTYRIPSLLATGLRREDGARPHASPAGRHDAQSAPPLSLRQLRLSAARARCDILLVFDYGYRIEWSVNGLVALNALIVPVFFVPFFDAEVRSHLDAYVIDTRNGYLYAQIESQEETELRRLGAFSERDRERVDRQWTELLGRTRTRLGRTLPAAPQQAVVRPAPPEPEPQ
ncbi:MAG: hypothetical protein IT379_14150 [Deltaproteobacteria bacterium]|nr:hypothetical protein [Deltaproteobacteria bacterium]